MPFTLEDILDDIVEATGRGGREWHSADQYLIISRGRVRDRMTAEQYRQWLIRCAKANKKYYLKNKHKFLEWSRKYYQTAKGRAQAKERRRRWAHNNPEKVRELRHRWLAQVHADPVKLSKKRKRDREAQRRCRARKKNKKCT